VTPIELSQLLSLYSWFALAALIFFLLLIARFYERFAAERTFFRMFTFPAILFGAAAVRYASVDRVVGDPIGDLMSALAGIILSALCIALFRRMILGRKNPKPSNSESDDHADSDS
jgi:hypothetical protein